MNGALDGATETAGAWWAWLRDGVVSVFDFGAITAPERPATPAPQPAPGPGVSPRALLVGAVLVAGLILARK
jgi:hypothetical protein